MLVVVSTNAAIYTVAVPRASDLPQNGVLFKGKTVSEDSFSNLSRSECS
jgi:hypothetical protein